MARIRSTHPGQWTSGDFLECSPLARLLALALRNVADDHGVFRWKPTTLKAECLPADNCDVNSLLDELIENEQVIKFDFEGKSYGIIKDFTQWQRPKKPKYIHPVPNWFSTSSEPELDDDRTEPEIPPQRKEEGGSIDGGGETQAPARKLISEEAFEIAGEVLEAMGLHREDPKSVGAPMTVQSWLNGGWPREVIVVGVKRAMANRSGDPPGTLKYFEKAIARQHAENSRPLPVATMRPQENFSVSSNAKPRNAIIQAADDLCQRIASFDGPPRGLDELRGGEGKAPVRQLSNG